MMLSKKNINQLYTLFIILGLTACGANKVSVRADIPQPLVEKLPLTGHLLLTDEFTNYQYSEDEKKRSLSNLSFGPAQTFLYEQIFTQLLSLSETSNITTDVIIEPEILDFQYTTPSETKLNLYEVWLRYRVKITDSQNKTLADWVVKGYGKTPSSTFKTVSRAFNAATNVALRDVGAQLAIGFPQQPAIQTLLNSKQSVQPNNIKSQQRTEPTERAEVAE